MAMQLPSVWLLFSELILIVFIDDTIFYLENYSSINSVPGVIQEVILEDHNGPFWS